MVFLNLDMHVQNKKSGISSLWLYHCHLHPLQAANCCRNSQLVVDEDDLKSVKNEKQNSVIINQFHKRNGSETPNFGKFRSFFRDAKWWCLNASWGFKGLNQRRDSIQRPETRLHYPVPKDHLHHRSDLTYPKGDLHQKRAVAYPEINYGGCSDFKGTIQQQGPIGGMPPQNFEKINIK